MKNLLTLLLLLSSIWIAQAQRNVVLIIADDLGSDWCGFQENRVDTVNMPNVRKLLSRGVRFSNAWANLSTDPSERTNLLTRTLTATELTNYNYLCTEMGTLLGRTICNAKVDTKESQVWTKPTIAPNPAKNLITVSFNDALPFDFQLSSIDGKLLKKGSSSKEINVFDLPNGLFLLKIQKQGAIFTEKIVIEK